MRHIKVPVAMLISGVAIACLSFGAEALVASQTRQQSSIEVLQKIFQPRRRSGGTRGPICLITPGLRPTGMPLSASPLVFSDRPLFVWQKPVARVEVLLANNAVIWSQSLSPNSRRVFYQGTPLQPGQIYQVIAFSGKNNPLNNGEDTQFILVEASQRQQIIEELAGIEAELRKQNRSEEAIAIAKAVALSKRALLSDAVQLLYAVPDPSPELNAFLVEIRSKVCDQE